MFTSFVSTSSQWAREVFLWLSAFCCLESLDVFCHINTPNTLNTKPLPEMRARTQFWRLKSSPLSRKKYRTKFLSFSAQNKPSINRDIKFKLISWHCLSRKWRRHWACEETSKTRTKLPLTRQNSSSNGGNGILCRVQVQVSHRNKKKTTGDDGASKFFSLLLPSKINATRRRRWCLARICSKLSSPKASSTTLTFVLEFLLFSFFRRTQKLVHSQVTSFVFPFRSSLLSRNSITHYDNVLACGRREEINFLCKSPSSLLRIVKWIKSRSKFVMPSTSSKTVRTSPQTLHHETGEAEECV